MGAEWVDILVSMQQIEAVQLTIRNKIEVGSS